MRTAREIVVKKDLLKNKNISVKIGTIAIAAAGSVVTKNVEANTFVGGVPAKYLQFKAVTGYVDGSRGEVYYRERHEMPIKLSCPKPVISSLGRVHFIRCVKLP